MKILITGMIICLINLMCIASTPGNINIKSETKLDTLPPTMQPLSPPDTSTRNHTIDTTHMIH